MATPCALRSRSNTNRAQVLGFQGVQRLTETAISQEPETVVYRGAKSCQVPWVRGPVSGPTRATAALRREVRLTLTLGESSSSSGRREGEPAGTDGQVGPLENVGWEASREGESQASRQGPADRHRPRGDVGRIPDFSLRPKGRNTKDFLAVS